MRRSGNRFPLTKSNELGYAIKLRNVFLDYFSSKHIGGFLMQTPLVPRQPVPNLTVPIVDGSTWTLADQTPQQFTLLG